MFLMNQFLRKVFSLYFDFSQINSRGRTQVLKLRVSTEAAAHWCTLEQLF